MTNLIINIYKRVYSLIIDNSKCA